MGLEAPVERDRLRHRCGPGRRSASPDAGPLGPPPPGGSRPTGRRTPALSPACPLCSLPPSRAPGGVIGGIREIVARRNDERWTQKLRRVRWAISDALMAESTHELRGPEAA